MEAPPYIFTAEGGPEDGLEVRLEGADLPRYDDTRHAYGSKLEETATRYPSGDTAVQVHGRKREPVELSGVFEDRKWQQGHALEMREEVLKLLEAPVVRLDYGEDRRWGTMGATFEEERRDKIHYTIRFRPYWTEPPESEVIMEFQPPANDMAVAADQQLQQLDVEVRAAPPSVPFTFGKDLLTAVGSAMNKYASVLQKLHQIVGYADLAESIAAQIESAIRGVIAEIEAVIARLKRTDYESLSENSGGSGGGGGGSAAASASGIQTVTAAAWAADAERQARRARGSLVEMIREFIARRQGRGASTYVVGQGETLQSIAQDQLGDWSRWTDIADRNDLPNASVEPGDELKMPPS
jgi:hypothetical protein